MTFSGTTSIGSQSIVGVVSATGLQAGEAITGSGIQSGTTISAITMPTVTLSNSASTNANGVTLASNPLLSFTGQINSDSQTISNVSSVVNLVPGQTITAGSLFPAGTTISGFSPAVVTLSQSAQQAGVYQFTSNGVTFSGTTSVGSASIVGVLSTAGLQVAGSITGTGIPAGTTISAITMPTVTVSNLPTNISEVATLVSGTPVSFTGDVNTASETVSNVSSVANLVSGQTVTSSTLFPAGTTISSFTTAVVTLSQPAQQAGLFQFTSNGVTFSGTTSVGSQAIVGVVSATGLQVAGSITGTGIESGTTISAITMPTVTLNNLPTNTNAGVTLDTSTPISSFSGDVIPTSQTINNVSSVANLVAGQTLASGSMFPTGTTISGFTPATITLSQPAQHAGVYQFTSNGVTFSGTTTVGSQSIAGVLSTTGLQVAGSITGTGIPVGTTITGITMPTVTASNLPTNVSEGATLVSNAINSTFPIQVVFTPTTGSSFSGSTAYTVT